MRASIAELAANVWLTNLSISSIPFSIFILFFKPFFP
jgi:hypothetical protein